MALLSELVAQGRVRNREDLRRVYRRLVKKFHPDSAIAYASRAGTEAAAKNFVDFDRLRKELEEAESLLAELDAAELGAAPSSAYQPRGGGGAPRMATAGPLASHAASTGPVTGPASFDRDLLINELRDLIARGFPVQPRALARNKAYRTCVATVSAQLALLTGEADAFARTDADMRAVRASSLSLIYHVMQVLWNGLDWGIMGLAWARHAALRDYATIRDELVALDLRALDRLLSWIIEADRPPSFGERAGLSRR